ncbi:MAG TPA: response regulator [Candidatus Kapabacteria bacterium]|jgi:DNA-binding NtrC family response regulator|nr:response regulator [Candidatus Kapabacteria bacterium]HOM06024.1 response regulator [Candidatus Kapabacteria bacterium]HOQ48930.1 response regulator [Candidatus Kapabacteria bacterium]HPP39322.1 response regulator [Candidatus Kapabacteria bacterium]HPU22791.1 response regulator [Candidatus Kapabacteria bacterium]
MRVLLIDDDISSLEVLNDVLVLNGFECDAFENPLKAIQHFKRGKYIAVLTDYLMKEMNGIDLMKEIKKIDPDTPVIIYSACDQFNLDEVALKNGATNFFSKPVSWIDIEKVLSKLKELAIERVY